MEMLETSFRSEGLRIGAQLVMPDAEPVAGVVCITGGSKSAEELFTDWQRFMGQAGIASLAFDARGKGSSEGGWDHRDRENPACLPVNSQRSRVYDTLRAMDTLQRELHELGADGRGLALIGNSMGADVALHVAAVCAPAALVLKAPPAYSPQAHRARFGFELSDVLRDQENYPALDSPNFEVLRAGVVPAMTIFPAGEEIIPPEIQETYMEATWAGGGEVVIVGDRSTGHGYFFDSADSVARLATKKTLKASTDFILRHAARGALSIA